MLFVASVAAGVANYAFGLLCVHQLGAQIYADVAAITSIAMILTVPLAGLQAAYSRDVAIALGREDQKQLAGLRAFARSQAMRMQVAVFLLAAAIVPIAHTWGGVDDLYVAMLLPLLTLGSTLVPILGGFLQGAERYVGLSVLMGIGGILRFAGAPLGIVLAGAAGALFAGVIGSVVAAIVAIVLARSFWRIADVESNARPLVRPTTTTLATVSLVSYAVLGNADLIIAPIVLNDGDAGNYAAATIAGRGMAFVATTVSLLLLTSTSRRISHGLDTWVPLKRTVTIVAAFGIVLAAACALVPDRAYVFAFGTQDDARVLVSVSVLALTGAGLVNNLLNYALAHRIRWFVGVVLCSCLAYMILGVAFVASEVQLAGLLLATVSMCVAVFFARLRGGLLTVVETPPRTPIP